MPPPVPESFLVTHDLPGARAVELTSGDGTTFSAAYALAPEPGGVRVLLLPDVRGLFAYYRNLARSFAAAGHSAIVVDYFGRTAGTTGRPDRNVVLTQQQHEFVDSLVKSGRYQNASEVLREGLRLMEREQAEEAAKTDDLRQAAAQGWSDLDSGQFDDVDDRSLDDFVAQLGLRAAASGHEAGWTDRPELGDGVFSWRLALSRSRSPGGNVYRPRHLLFCRRDGDVLVVGRVLHDAMELR